jgi:hypothetical protein
MIVYGDPQFTERSTVLLDRLRGLAETASNLDSVRSLLTATGQLEQGLSDAHSVSKTLTREQQAMALTDAAARLFLQRLRNESCDPAEFLRVLGEVDEPDEELRIKIPEGFAFYALYPEQYEATARNWSKTQDARKRQVLVVGIRSIGTTLSAVVAETLRLEGWKTRRVTVRPEGHPYDRRATLQIEAIDDTEWAIVVDEGPGRSGSSMAAVARSLVEKGFAQGRVLFFPAHENEPGPEAPTLRRRFANAGEKLSAITLR